MNRQRLDPVIHGPNRLQICALLSPVNEAEFAILRDELEVSDSVLSKHIRQLEDAGYVELRKGKMNGHQRTWAKLTKQGRLAFEAHIEELARLAQIANGTHRRK